MRMRLAIVGILLILSGVGIWWATFTRLLFRLGLRWEQPFLIGQFNVIVLAGLWAVATGFCCFCRLLFTWPKVRAKAAPLPGGLAVAILLLAAVVTGIFIAGFDGEMHVRRLEGPNGTRAMVLARSSLTPSASLWLGGKRGDPVNPDFRVGTEVWGSYEFRPSATTGRYLLVGRRSEAGALIDLNVPSMVAWHQLPDLETLRAEFGSDIALVPSGD